MFFILYGIVFCKYVRLFVIIVFIFVIIVFLLVRVVIGYDEGIIMIKFGCEEFVVSMDNSGKIIWVK